MKKMITLDWWKILKAVVKWFIILSALAITYITVSYTLYLLNELITQQAITNYYLEMILPMEV